MELLFSFLCRKKTGTVEYRFDERFLQTFEGSAVSANFCQFLDAWAFDELLVKRVGVLLGYDSSDELVICKALQQLEYSEQVLTIGETTEGGGTKELILLLGKNILRRSIRRSLLSSERDEPRWLRSSAQTVPRIVDFSLVLAYSFSVILSPVA